MGIKSGVLNSIRSALSFFTQNSSLDLVRLASGHLNKILRWKSWNTASKKIVLTATKGNPKIGIVFQDNL